MNLDKLVYYDTNVWVSWMRGKDDKFFPTCKKLIDDIISGKKTAIVPYLVLLETIHTLRRKIIENSKFTGDSRDECMSKRSEVDKKIREFIGSIRELSRHGNIIIIRPNTSVHDHHATVLRKLQSYFGYVRVLSFCPYCKGGIVPRESNNECQSCGHSLDSIKKYEYKGLGHADLEHAYFAKQSSVPIFYSSDKSFKNLRRDSDFSSINFQIINPP